MRAAWRVLVLVGVATATLAARQGWDRLQTHGVAKLAGYGYDPVILTAVCDKGNGAMVYVVQGAYGTGINSAAVGVSVVVLPNGCKKAEGER